MSSGCGVSIKAASASFTVFALGPSSAPPDLSGPLSSIFPPSESRFASPVRLGSAPPPVSSLQYFTISEHYNTSMTLSNLRYDTILQLLIGVTILAFPYRCAKECVHTVWCILLVSSVRDTFLIQTTQVKLNCTYRLHFQPVLPLLVPFWCAMIKTGVNDQKQLVCIWWTYARRGDHRKSQESRLWDSKPKKDNLFQSQSSYITVLSVSLLYKYLTRGVHKLTNWVLGATWIQFDWGFGGWVVKLRPVSQSEWMTSLSAWEGRHLAALALSMHKGWDPEVASDDLPLHTQNSAPHLVAIQAPCPRDGTSPAWACTTMNDCGTSCKALRLRPCVDLASRIMCQVMARDATFERTIITAVTVHIWCVV